MTSMTTSDYDYLTQHREIWQRKTVLRRIYSEQFYRALLAKRAPGRRTLEIGSGPGFLSEIDPSVIRTDILHSPWVHCVVDAHHLPFGAMSLDNVIGLDVLHHFTRPLAVLREITRVLRPGGRFILVEPWITPFSRFVYTYLHQEGCNLNVHPWDETEDQFGAGKRAFDGNGAIPYLLIEHGGKALRSAIPELDLRSVERFSLLTYLLSLGFKRGTLLPHFAYDLLYQLERSTHPLWSRLAALRALIVWERVA